MDRTVLISGMHKFHFGRKIFCSDGEDGVLTHVGFDPATRRLISLGVRQGRLFGKTVFLPFTSVVTASGDGIRLNITRAALAEASTAVSEGVWLDNRSVVKNSDGAKGGLLIVAVHPESGELAYSVARHLRPGRDTLIRREMVTALGTGQVSVSVSKDVLETLPPYRPDSELQQEVEKILFDLAPLHIDFKGIAVRVLDCVLYLD